MTELSNALLNVSYPTKTQEITGEPNGFVDWSESDMAFDEASRTLSISPVAASYDIFSAGVRLAKGSEETFTIPDVEGIHYVYFDENGDPNSTQSFDPRLIFGPWNFVSVIIWDAINKELPFGTIQNERHGLMDGSTHSRLHNDEGLRITQGLNLVDFDLSEDGSLLTCCQFGRNSGSIADEDIMPDVAARASTVSPHVVYISGSEADPVWRKGSPTANTAIINAASGRAMYNKLDAGTWSLAEVPDGYYVNYHSIITTSNTSGKEEFVVPGHAIYSSKSEAIVKQIEEVVDLVSKAGTTKIALAEYHAIGSVLIHTDDTYTNSTKSIIVSIGGGRSFNDFRDFKLNNGSAIALGNPVIPTNLVRGAHADFILAESDMEVHIHNVSDKIIGTIPAIANLERIDRPWLIGKISQDLYPAIVTLETPSDSQAGEQEHSWKLEKPGDFLRISITEHGKYNIQFLPNASQYVSQIAVATLTPSIVTTSLTCNGDLVDISAESSVDASFRYREIGELTWIDSTGASVSAEGTFDEVVTVTSGLDYEVQAVAEDITGNIYYGDVKNTIANYYADIPAAKSDGLLRYWDLQETSGTDTDGVEKLGSGEAMICSGGVTISSDVIATRTIYKRVFTSQARMVSDFAFDNRASNSEFSILIQVDSRTTSGDHTIFSTGANKLSLAADGTTLQMSVNSGLNNWTSATPTGMVNILIRSNSAQNMVQMHTPSFNSIVWRAQATGRVDTIFDYLRMAFGTNGDSNHQAGEYLANGDIRSIAFWSRSISDAEAIDISNTTDIKGMLIV